MDPKGQIMCVKDSDCPQERQEQAFSSIIINITNFNIIATTIATIIIVVGLIMIIMITMITMISRQGFLINSMCDVEGKWSGGNVCVAFR